MCQRDIIADDVAIVQFGDWLPRIISASGGLANSDLAVCSRQRSSRLGIVRVYTLRPIIG
jgi:hypothetical protein